MKHSLLESPSDESTDARLLIDVTTLNLPAIRRENALKTTWQYYVQQGHLPSWRQELLRDSLLLMFSGGSGLYFLIVKTYVKGKPEWLAQSYLYSTMLSAASILINSTNEFILLRNRRQTPAKLRGFNLAPSKRQLFLTDLCIVLVSAIASLSLTTAAWRYSASWPFWLRALWTATIELVNTGLHLLPVELVAFNHPVYSLPFKPFKLIYQTLQCPTQEQKKESDFMAFKCHRAAILTERFTLRLDRAVQGIINKHFTWKTSSLAYVGQSPNSLQKLLEADDIIPIIQAGVSGEAKASVKESCNSLLLKFIYCIGAVWVVLSNLGFVADPFYTLGSSANSYLGLALAALAAYFLGVLLAHMGGSSLQEESKQLARIIQRKASVPLPAKIHTKIYSFLVLPMIAYIAPFSSASAEQMVFDHFGATAIKPALIWAARTGVAYFTITNLLKLYSDYSEKFARLCPGDANHLVAVLKHRIEDFKRHIPSDPDVLTASFSACSNSDLRLLIGMSRNRFDRFTDYRSQYRLYSAAQQKLRDRPSYCKKLLENCLFKSRTDPMEDPLLATASPSITLASYNSTIN